MSEAHGGDPNEMLVVYFFMTCMLIIYLVYIADSVSQCCQGGNPFYCTL